MKFLLRDDDPCGFTHPSDIENCYSEYWGKLPINLSVTPFRIPGNSMHVPLDYRGLSKPMPLHKNRNMVDYLKKKIACGHIDVAMHGFYHTRDNGIPEYAEEKELTKKTREGKQYLEDLLDCPIQWFVPPYNNIRKDGLMALIENNLNLVGMPSLINKDFRSIKARNFHRAIRNKYYGYRYNVGYPKLLRVDGHFEVFYYSITPSQTYDYLRKSFDVIKKLDGIFILSTHYYASDYRMKSGQKIRDVIDEFIQEALQNEKIQMCRYSDLFIE